MPITLITGPANAGKAREVLDAVRGHLARGEEPLLLVPTRADVERYRRELALEGTVLGARVERFEELIGEIVRGAGGREPGERGARAGAGEGGSRGWRGRTAEHPRVRDRARGDDRGAGGTAGDAGAS